jgi:oxygen-independent coproporphyrinogen-3 oxidase
VRLYLDALWREADRRTPLARGTDLATLYLGGGTPSRLEPAALAALVGGLRDRFAFAADAERTLEANPEDVDDRRLAAWREAGIDRLSIGVQSLDDGELRRLGRVHDAEAARAAMRRAAASFARWSVDLIYAFPGHTLASWRATLAQVLALGPPHVSAYHFTAERGTPMGDAVRAGRVRAPIEDEAAGFFDAATAALEAAGYDASEISNFARPGQRSRHNVLYWRRRPVLGLGPGAVSFWAERRWRNEPDPARWRARLLAGAGAAAERERTDALCGRETVMLGLRLREGVPWTELASLPDAPAWRSSGEALAARGLLAIDGEGARVPRRWRRLTDTVVLSWWDEAARRAPRAEEKRRT